VPIAAPIRLRFDRLLLPSSVTRGALRVYTGTRNNTAPYSSPRYDVLRGEVTVEFVRPLQRKVLYQLELSDPRRGGVGFRAFDGAPLDPGDRGFRWSFVTSGEAAGSGVVAGPERQPTCEDVLPMLTASCAGCCHGGDEPSMGLSFENATALRETAIGRPAHQTETGNTLGVPFQSPDRFGVAMPVIAPNASENSYLVYKLLLAPDNANPCASPSECERFADFDVNEPCLPPSSEESARLREWFVQGGPMPPLPGAGPSNCANPRRLDCPSMRVLTRWINQGARCE